MKQKRVGLVLEGGSMRGLFTAGVIDTFLEENIKVDTIIGVSAGALFGPNYFSKQKGRVLRYNKMFCRNKHYMSIESFLFTGNLINKQFAFYDVTEKYDPFDNETFMKHNTGYYATITNVESGKAEYIKINDIVEELEVLRASSAIPFVSRMVEINGKKYLDGGVSDAIPIQKCRSMGFDQIIVVLTRPIDYRKQPLSKMMMQGLRIKYRKYPKFVEALEKRYLHYNETVEQIIDLENKKEIFVIRPSVPINLHTIERDPDALQAVYDLGVKDACKAMKRLKEYLEEDS